MYSITEDTEHCSRTPLRRSFFWQLDLAMIFNDGQNITEDMNMIEGNRRKRFDFKVQLHDMT